MDKISIASLNVRGLQDQKKRQQIFSYVKSLRLDFAVLQETHSEADTVKLWKTEYRGELIASSLNSQSAGVAILIKRNLNVQIHQKIVDEQGRFIILDITAKEQRFTLAGLYGPNVDSPEFFNEVFENIEKIENVPLIVIGDFNLVLEENIDRKGSKERHIKAVQVVKRFIEKYELTDPWREQNPETKRYSWHRANPTYNASRIDFTLMDGSMSNLIDDIDYQYGHKTDHSLLRCDLELDMEKRGPGIWKLNNQLLEEKNYVERVNEIIEKAKNKKGVTPDIRWEWCQCEATLWSKGYSKTRAQQKNKRFNHIKEKVDRLEKENCQNQGASWLCLKEARATLEALITEKAQAAAF